MKRSIYKDALIRVQEEEQGISLESKNVIEESCHMTIFLRNLLSELKNHISENGFKDENEEIEFFKMIKPQILGKLIYYNKIFRIETSCPVSIGKLYYKYFSEELQELKQEYKEDIYNSEFYRYYKSGRTDYDHNFFLLGKINRNIVGLNSFVFEIDPQFSTYYDYKISRIIANGLLYNYLLIRTNPDETEQPQTQLPLSNKDIFWTDSKNALIELIYALYASRVISNGKVGIKKISNLFQIAFRVKLGNLHHAFHRMKDRAGSRVTFLEHLKDSLEQYMDKEL